MALRLCLGAILACAAALMLKKDNPLGGFLVAVAFCVVALVALLPVIGVAVGKGKLLLQEAGLDTQLFSPLLRILGITVCTRISAELCRDAGQDAVAAKLELAGAAAGVLCALPLAQQVLELVGGIT
ncbi:MAG: stage III sporulation AC/AD family protein [Clostridiaceae bacterium]|nr:stage III sporulation AC/AD family protein [Clostridiaceae bacterium]